MVFVVPKCVDRDEAERLVVQVRDHFVAQFRTFVEEQRRGCTVGWPEVKLKLKAQSENFGNFRCLDFIKRDPEYEFVKLAPANVLLFTPISVQLGAAMVTIDALQWHDAVVEYDLVSAPPAIGAWFNYWFDLDNERDDLDADLLGIIHLLIVKQGALGADFGTAPASVFWELMQLLEEGGAKNIRVGGVNARRRLGRKDISAAP
jgi:hypothetical protein